MSTKDKKRARYEERKEFALTKYRQHITWALVDLEWTKIDRRAGWRDFQLESLARVAQHREKALWWYARYKKYCGKIAQLEEVA